jgi:tetratricopeptide (TPR) repeat protein
MKKIVLIVVLCLLAGLPACSRKGASTQNNTNTQVQTTVEAGVQARSLLDSGKEFYRNDQDEKAIQAFEDAIKLDPDLAEAHFRLGLSYDAVGRQQEAEESYKRAVESYKKYFSVEENTKDAEAHYNLAQAYAGLHLYSEAVREYRQANKLKENDADIYYDLGMALTKLAQYDEAVAAFSKSLEIDPSNFRAEDGLEEAREGVQRIKAGKKHQEDLLKKEKEEELKKLEEGATPDGTTKPAAAGRPTSKPAPTKKP